MMKTTTKIAKLFVYSLILSFMSASITYGAGTVKSVKDVFVDLNLVNASVKDAFNQLEGKTDFKFHYNNSNLKNDAVLSKKYKQASVADILIDIAKETQLKFKQVNNVISVNKVAESTLAVESVEVEIMFTPVTVTVVDENNEPLPGVNVVVKGTSTGTTTDISGQATLDVADGAVLVISYIGYTTEEITVGTRTAITVNMSPDSKQLQEIVVVGSRNQNRTVLESPVPVDVINIENMAINSPQINVNQLLNYVAPSFTSNTQTISDGTDHIDPASLRGLGPDQVLVLINGKRRHNSSLINVNGTFGRGSVGTDLNAIPVAAIKRIEVLRDGAAAQYGSDAIAGVINIVLKESVNELNVNVTSGAYFSENSEDGRDGETVQFNMNYGLPIGKEGVINFTGNFDSRGYTNRMKEWGGQIFSDYNNPTDYPSPTGADITEAELQKRGLQRSDFNMRVGQSAVDNAGVFMNLKLPLGETAELYSFGGLTYRQGEAAGFYRLPYQSRAVTDIYPNGFLPEIHSNINDKSFALGIKGEIDGWKIDFSNSFGSNGFQYQIENTLNASLEASSPTSFNSGGFIFAQNTTNFDVNKFWDDKLSGVNLAFGAEYRVDNYQIFAGEEGSYTNYGLASWQVSNSGDSTLVVDNKGPVSTVFGLDGTSPRPGGAQVFPGFSPDNELSKFRSNVGVYVDGEVDFTDNITLTGALRYEDYSDFGSTFNWKTSFRAEVVDGWAFRGAASTGFRAPSLHQQYFNSTSTIFVDGVPSEVGTFSNDSRPAKLLGIPQLKQETSNNYSVGFTGQLGDDLSLTVDGYMVNITDRIVYTGQFSGVDGGTAKEQEVFDLLSAANATRAGFFANAIDTKTKGVDIVLTHNAKFGIKSSLRTSLAATFSQTLLDGDVKTSDALIGKESTYFDETSRIFLESAVPRKKINLTFDFSVNERLSVMLRNVYFGEVSEATNNVDNQQEFAAKVITDLSVNYKISDSFTAVIGSSNLLDVYPDEAIVANQSSGRFLYSRRSQQFGANGRFVFAKLAFVFK
ncbi:MAG: TonB-dependent receptor [Cyclobacteriaceae bacterium]|nr:TonB-dependent receptor [Cyclobacteriaceae bacterium]